jgi:hypothetical protein
MPKTQRPLSPMPRCRHCGAECEGGRHPVPDQWFCYACRRWQGDRYCPTCHGRVGDHGLALTDRDRGLAPAGRQDGD